ncbi:MAG: hypothetical protein FWE72_04165 [Spirochaetaceae bacterium]|nr:hypothetical protein [Spirochaetaceae bacterium]
MKDNFFEQKKKTSTKTHKGEKKMKVLNETSDNLLSSDSLQYNSNSNVATGKLVFRNFRVESGFIEGLWVIGMTNDGSNLFFAASKSKILAKGVQVIGSSITLNVYHGDNFLPYTGSVIVPAYALNIYDFLEETTNGMGTYLYRYNNTTPIMFSDGNANIDFIAQMALFQAPKPKIRNAKISYKV